jgi:cyclophilin family peptidyl-prolyl cis-trans isomerase
MASHLIYLSLLVFCGFVHYSESCNNTLVTQKVFFDIYIGDDYTGRMVIGLFGDTTPISAMNFAAFASNRGGVGYQNTIFHRVYNNFVVQGGDFVAKPPGSGSASIFYNNSKFFDDENFIFWNLPGWIGYANMGPNTNGCQFYINMADNWWLDGKNVVFAKVLSGMDIIYQVGNQPVDSDNKPITPVTVAWTGTFLPLQPYYVPYQGY